MQEGLVEEHLAAPSGPIRGQAAGLAGVRGNLGVTVAGTPLGVLIVDQNQLEFRPGEGPIDASVAFSDRADLVRLLRGELNPVVATLQDRMRVEGDPVFAAKVILGLRAGSSFKGQRVEEG